MVDVAKETLEKNKELRKDPGSEKVVKMLETLSGDDLSRKRRESYITILRLLCRHHVYLWTCSEQEFLAASLLKKYYPSPDVPPAWIPHVGLTRSERELITKDKANLITHLQEVLNWEESLREEDDRRQLYLERYSALLGKVPGKPSVDQVALSLAAKVENNCYALERILIALNTPSSST